MNTELSSKYDPSVVESQAYAVWLEEKCFHADPAKPGEPYTIVIPPPNVTGALHLGHAINNTLQDILTRQHRMRGFNTLWIPGIDHAGIATQAMVEKQLKEKENKTRHDVGREGLVERIWTWKKQFGDRILEQLQRMGCSCDWDRTRFTLDEQCARAVRETFFKLFKDGLIYRGKRLVNWDTFLQTSISDDEIYHETVKTSLWHLRYPIVDADGNAPKNVPLAGVENDSRDMRVSPMPGAPSAENAHDPESARTMHGRDAHVTTGQLAAGAAYMVVATTRPETMLGDTAVAVHSEDPRWNWAIGKFVKLPLTGRLIPIIADDILVDPKFGTGVVKVTPAHDPNDYAVWQRHKGQPDEIEIINILTPDGKIVDDARWKKYAGLKRDAARRQVVEDLAAEGLLEKEEPYETQVGHSDRSKTPVEPYLSDQWFVKMAPLAEPALEVVRDGTIKFFPERYAQTYLAWLGEKRDWPISRQLWWGHRIPVWSRRVQLGDGASLMRWTFIPDQGAETVRVIRRAETGEAVSDNFARANPGEYDIYFCSTSNSIVANLEKHGFVQDPDVLDTWFSSALWPHSTLGWPEQTPELAKYYPTNVLLTGRDIITLWVARMVMTGMYNMGDHTSPSPLYSGERDGVRGESFNEQDSRDRQPSPSPQPSPPSTRERGQEPTAHGDKNYSRDTGVPPVPGAPSVGNSAYSESESTMHGRDAHVTTAQQSERAKRLGIPFSHVVINPTILDGKGERMSKTKGNGVDPLDIIYSHGADALRLTLTNMATETQDARMPVQIVCPNCGERLPNPDNKEPFMTCSKCKKKFTRPISNATGSPDALLARMTSDRFDNGRNFCNKLWNACRFALSNLEGVPQEEPDEQKWSLADRWIVSRFNRAVEEVNGALENYRFDVYAKSVYDFFWRDFCDWYVEAIKPALKDPARRGQTANVLAAVIDGCLRLMHPMIPFITETVWWRLNDVRPTRGLPGRIECPPGKRLVLSAWPTVGDFSQASEHIFPRLQEIIVAIRNLRNEHQVNPKQTVNVSIRSAAEPTRQIATNQEMIELLATCTIAGVGPEVKPPQNAATASVAGCDIFIEGLINPNAERQRVEKGIEDATKNINALKGRLSSEAYIAKAPPHLVQQTREQLAALEAELIKLEEARRKM